MPLNPTFTIALAFVTLPVTVALSARDIPPPYASPNPLTEPTLFGEGIISAGEFDSHPAFTPDGKTLYFVRSTPQFTDWKIYESHWKLGRWTQPEMAPFSGKYADADPYVTPDGRRLYFISDRPVNGVKRGDMDIWVLDRTKDGWGDPRNVGAVNSTGNEWFPSLSRDGTLYFGSDRPGGQGKTDVYRARPAKAGFHLPENLGSPVNTASDEFEPYVTPDESYLIFAATRPGGQGGMDLWLSRRVKEGWTEPANLGPKVNRPGMEIGARVSPDGKYLFWSSMRRDGPIDPKNRPNRARNGLGDIYQMDLRAVLAGVK
jgi:hypothetical protein